MKPQEATVIHAEMFDKKKYDHDDMEIYCDGCGLEYTLTEYKILKENKKLVYFLYDEFTVCHGCLFKEIASGSPGGTARLKVIDYGASYFLNFEEKGDPPYNVGDELG